MRGIKEYFDTKFKIEPCRNQEIDINHRKLMEEKEEAKNAKKKKRKRNLQLPQEINDSDNQTDVDEEEEQKRKRSNSNKTNKRKISRSILNLATKNYFFLVLALDLQILQKHLFKIKIFQKKLFF